MALQPSVLQGLMNYPIVFTGIVMAPRAGIGTMFAMMVVGRLIHRIDVRAIMAVGFALTAFSLYLMTQITLDMDSTLIVVSGTMQGLGIGLTFVPLSAVAFSTLAPSLRNDGTPIYSLLRNIGASFGISIVQAMLSESMARAHAQLSEAITPFSAAVQNLPAPLSVQSPTGLALLNLEINRQAAMIGYLSDFHMMMWLTLLAMPMLLLVRKPAAAVPTPKQGGTVA